MERRGSPSQKGCAGSRLLTAVAGLPTAPLNRPQVSNRQAERIAPMIALCAIRYSD